MNLPAAIIRLNGFLKLHEVGRKTWWWGGKEELEGREWRWVYSKHIVYIYETLKKQFLKNVFISTRLVTFPFFLSQCLSLEVECVYV